MHLPAPVPQDDEFYLQMNLTRGPGPVFQDPLDDVFGSDSETPPIPSHGQPHGGIEISLDSRRLQSQHTTEGYREGITTGKAGSIQAGFDEGFGLGASIGLEAGALLGLLDGVAAALRSAGGEASTRADELLLEGKKELSTDTIFGEEYWTRDGNWKYPVARPSDDGQLLFEHVAKGHPIIVKWNRIIQEVLQAWKVDRCLSILKDDASQLERGEPASAKSEPSSRQAIDW